MSDETKPRVSARGKFSWMLFDWAQQPFHTLIITFVFAPYFASAVAPDAVKGQEWWGYAVGAGGILVALLAPLLGAIADATGPRKPWIAAFALLGALGCWLLWYATPGSSDLTLVLAAICLAIFGMEFAAIFNNAMMPGLVPRSELGRLSGSAWGLGYVGGLLTLVLVLGFMAVNAQTGKTLIGIDPLFGLDPASRQGERAAGPLTAIWMLVFILPMFLFTPDARRKPQAAGAVRRGLAELGATLKRLPSDRSYFSFLLSSMFYRDALNALYTFGGIYASGVLKWEITQIGIFGILANLTGALGAWLGGKLDDRVGPKTVVTGNIILLIGACTLIISTTPETILFMPIAAGSALPDIVFYVAGALIGAAGGSLQAASRTLLVDQVPPEKVTEAFGLYALTGRATAFIGPFAIGIVTAMSQSQRIGVTPVIALFVVGAVLLIFVRAYEPKK